MSLSKSMMFLIVLFGAIFLAQSQAGSMPDDPAKLLQRADGLESSNPIEFRDILRKLTDPSLKLTSSQQLYRRYLMARQIVFLGKFKAAIPLMTEIADQSSNPVLSFRASATLVDLFITQSRYVDAFDRLTLLLERLPHVTDHKARIQALGVASQLYLESGQYEQAVQYAKQLLGESDSPKSACVAWYYMLNSFVRGGQLEKAEVHLRDGVNTCDKAGDVLIAYMFKSVVARFYIDRGKLSDAISLLLDNYGPTKNTLFPPAVSDFNELLALAYWKSKDFSVAKYYAIQVIANNKNIGGIYSESTTTAYRILYSIAKKQGDLGDALAYHESYMTADKGYLNDISVRALAYQTVMQNVLAKKLQIERLDKKNQVLGLQTELARKEVETTRLSVLLLLIVLASVAWWTYRLKRSQIKFRKLARRDGLTDILNRQHFMEEAQQRLAYCQKSARDACLILIDLDHFKHVNDTHGHAMGDQVLKRAVASCQQYLRSTDVFGRLGGEEFAILLPECSLEQVRSRVELLRAAIAAAPTEEAQSISVSASFGVATSAGSGYELRQLLIHADDALYQAKHAGRNRAIIFDATEGMRHDQAMRKAREDAAAAAAEPGGKPAA